MAKRGRPRAQVLNPEALKYGLDARGMSKTSLCAEVGITPGQLGDALNDSRRKGIAPEKVDRIAHVLGIPAAILAPERLDRFVAIRATDPIPADAA